MRVPISATPVRRASLLGVCVLVCVLSGATAAAQTTDTVIASPPAVMKTDTARSESAIWTLAPRAAAAYINLEYQSRTGLVNSVKGYERGTMWDIASGLAALFCADQLDLIEGDVYDQRMRRVLKTLQTLPLYDDAAFNKSYHTDTGAMGARGDRAGPTKGYGWSALDIGRLLVWLRIIEVNQPQYHGEIAPIIGRLNMARLVVNGDLTGEDVGVSGVARRHQEGRVGYEQYAAHGFELWGQKPTRALDMLPHTTPVELWGLTLRRDWRGDSHLTSEPFILLGLELGMTPDERELAWRVLSAQRERYRRTGRVTMVSEDAMGNDEPYYFYYYNVLSDAEPFSVSAVGASRTLDKPRWVSAKAAFAWHALFPSDYTLLAVRTVLPAMGATGWASGVYEGTSRSTQSQNLNTAAVILEAALYNKIGRPLITTNVGR